MDLADALALVGERQLRYHETSHQYWLGSERCRSVTALAKIPADDFKLNEWRTRQVLRGCTLDRSLCEDAAAAWDDDSKLNDIAKRASEYAQADAKARRGVQTHAATERVDLDQPIITSQQASDGSLWRRTLDMYGLEIDPQWVERIVLYPQHLVAGRFDRVILYRGRRVLADIKTGWNAIRFPQETTTQLGLYLNAPLVAVDATFDGDVEVVDRWGQFPDDLDRDHAYVIRMPTEPDAEHGQLFCFDMHEGTVAARMAIWARHFQLNDRLCHGVESHPRIHRDQARLHELRRWVGMLSDDDRAALRARWDVNVLGRLSDDMSVAQIEMAEALLREIDPFTKVIAPPLPRDTWVARWTGHGEGGPPAAALPDEGETIDDETAGEILSRFHRLDVEAKSWISNLAVDADEAGVPILPTDVPSRRRFNLLLGLTDLCVHGIGDDPNVTMAALAAHDVEQLDCIVRPGILLGGLDAEGASRFATWVLALVEGNAVYDPHTNRLVNIHTNGEIHAHPSHPTADPIGQAADDR